MRRIFRHRERKECKGNELRLRALQTLTPRQREVVDRVAAGKTNREIAASLKVSRRTVEKHLENIFTALGVRTRTAVIYETGLNRQASS